MSDVEPGKFPTLDQHLRQEREGLRHLNEEGWRADLSKQATVVLSAEQGRNLLLVASGAIRKDIVEKIRLQLDTPGSAK